MDAQKKTALAVLAAINLLTVAKQFFYPGDYELLFWLLAAVPFFIYCRSRARVSMRIWERILLQSLLFTCIYLSFWWGSGYVEGFGSSPYTRSATGVLRNITLFGGSVVLLELARAFTLFSSGRGDRKMILYAAVTFYLYGLNIPAAQAAFSGFGSLLPYVGGTLLPGIMGIVFLTWLSGTAGPVPVLIYSLLPELVLWIMPALPKSGWQTKMMLGVAVPAAALMVMQSMTVSRQKRRESRKGASQRRRSNPMVWTAMISMLAFLFSFFLGLFPYKPMVIATGSMLPVIRPGDMVILHETDPESLAVGDIAAYRTEGYTIVHRIMDIHLTRTGTSFTLKGDNNSEPDVKAIADTQIQGRVVCVIPYMGLLSLAVRTAGPPQSIPVETGNASNEGA